MKAARREEGVAMVEFALLLAPLLFIIFGFLEFGLAANGKIDETHLTAEGARYAVVNLNPALNSGLSPATLQNYIRTRADTADLTGGQVCVSFPADAATGTSGLVGDPVKVTMTYTYSLIPFLGSEFNKFGISLTSLPVSGDATMRLEALPTTYSAGCYP